MSDHSQEQAQSQYETIVELATLRQTDWSEYFELKVQREELLEEIGRAEDWVDETESELRIREERGVDAPDDELLEAREALSETQSHLEAFDNDEGLTLQDITDLLARYDFQDETDPDELYDEIVMRIEESPLSVQVRSGWVTPGRTMEAEEFEILLCTGGPAVKLQGTLDQHGNPDSCELLHQDWFESWERYTPVNEDTLLAYAQSFYFDYQ